ncbi:unnamed protein product [Polarella glacialis]|uniref:Uncharacterized protein n=1 Tax=Polarella glacialis TaxID=89957 RepID=A0A813DCZ5_POLGL|nr:unnamed protein product [Polarella glacialis]CAE8720385.1 unnamed protein product [Polarella glacialis]
MAALRRSRAVVPVVLALVAAAFCGAAFVAAPQPAPAPALRGASPAALAAAAAALLPAAAFAAPDVVDMDMGSSVTLATVEVLMLGIVVGTVPITVLGMMVAAWLQFKKGPTLGI